MEVLILLVVLALVGLGVAGFIGAASSGGDVKRRQAAEADAPAILDATFTGDDTVTVKVHASTLPWETYVTGGRDRGYDLTAESSELQGALRTLLFTRRSTTP